VGHRGTDWDARRYDDLADPHVRWGRDVLARLELLGEETVLDAGCGSGRVTEQLLAKVPRGRVVALDSSPAMLEVARRRLAEPAAAGRVRFVEADLLLVDLGVLGEDERLDAVFSTATFHWVTDHDRLFANLFSLLRPGGQLVAQCGGAGNIASVLAAVRALGVERPGLWLYPRPEETLERLARAGFVDARAWLEAQPTRFEEPSRLAAFLETVCLREHVADMGPEDARDFVEQVARRLPGGVIDYVRLNLVARRPPATD
jgi:trans-aconitate 2-methyltransferase